MNIFIFPNTHIDSTFEEENNPEYVQPINPKTSKHAKLSNRPDRIPGQKGFGTQTLTFHAYVSFRHS